MSTDPGSKNLKTCKARFPDLADIQITVQSKADHSTFLHYKAGGKVQTLRGVGDEAYITTNGGYHFLFVRLNTTLLTLIGSTPRGTGVVTLTESELTKLALAAVKRLP